MKDKRRAERIPVKLTVSVCLFDEKTDTVLSGPVLGEARDFSPLGLALSLASVRMGKYHIFFTCQDNSSHILKITFNLPDHPEKEIEIPARPIWYDRDKNSEEVRALFGMEFLFSPKEGLIKKLTKKLISNGKAPSSWWEKLF